MGVEDERQYYREKLIEWKKLGFDVSELDELLERDFEEFKLKKLEFLKNQILVNMPETMRESAGEIEIPKIEKPEEKIIMVEEERAREEEKRHIVRKKVKDVEHYSKAGAMSSMYDDGYDDEVIIQIVDEDELKKKKVKKKTKKKMKRVKRKDEEMEKTEEVKEDGEVEYEEEEPEVEEEIKVKRRKRKRKKGFKEIAVAVILVLLIAATGIFYLYSTTKLQPKMEHAGEAQAGELVEFDGAKSEPVGKIEKYIWKFGDGTTDYGKKVKHAFSEPNIYTVTLTVVSGDRKASTTSKIKILPLTVSVPNVNGGDRCSYSISGHASIYNNESGLYTIPISSGIGRNEIVVTGIDVDFKGTTDVYIKGTTTHEDGFFNQYECIHKYTVQSIQFTGNASTNMGTVPISGKADTEENSYYLPGEFTTICSESVVNSEFQISQMGSLGTMRFRDEMKSYPDIRFADSQFHIEYFYTGKTLSMNDKMGETSGKLEKGDRIFLWSIMNASNVNANASLLMHVRMDRQSMNEFNLTRFSLDLYLNSTPSAPTKVVMITAGKIGDTSFSSDYTLILTGFYRGSQSIGNSTSSIQPSPYPAQWFETWNRTPHGGEKIFEFTPREAMNIAIQRDSEFKNYLDSSNEIYATDANYSLDALKKFPTWNITFSKPDSETGYRIYVTKTLLNYTYHGEYVDGVRKVGIRASDIGNLMNLNKCQEVFSKSDEVASKFFKNGKIDFTRCSFLLQSDSPYGTIDITSMFASLGKMSYGYILTDGKTYAGINAVTGQFMYITTHITQ